MLQEIEYFVEVSEANSENCERYEYAVWKQLAPSRLHMSVFTEYFAFLEFRIINTTPAKRVRVNFLV